MSVEKEFATKAVVVLSGGCLVSVYANGPLEVELIDRDIIGDDDPVETVFEGMNEVW